MSGRAGRLSPRDRGGISHDDAPARAAGKALWGRRVLGEPGEALARLSVSHPFDRRLAEVGSARLARACPGPASAPGCFTAAALVRIERAIRAIGKEIDDGTFRFADADEDVHLNVERRLDRARGRGRPPHPRRPLSQRPGRSGSQALDAGGDRSGFDGSAIARLRHPVSRRGVPRGGHHRRRPNPSPGGAARSPRPRVSRLGRDDPSRSRTVRRRTPPHGGLPLGSGACAGSTLPLDREGAARELGLASLTQNSLDAVSDRDFAAEFEAAAAIAMGHLSRMAEDLILWTSDEFRLFDLSEATATGSSMMPQKRNPDSLELARGKAGRVIGNLVATLTILKGLPLSYDRDLQETQQPLFEAADALELSLAAVEEVVAGLGLVPESRRARSIRRASRRTSRRSSYAEGSLSAPRTSASRAGAARPPSPAAICAKSYGPKAASARFRRGAHCRVAPFAAATRSAARLRVGFAPRCGGPAGAWGPDRQVPA